MNQQKENQERIEEQKDRINRIFEEIRSDSNAIGRKRQDTFSATKKNGFINNFYIRPSDLIRYLSDKVIKQEEATRVLATAICNHYNAIRHRLEKGENPMDDVDRIKSNILLIGPTGVGKTYLLKLIVKKIGVPFVTADATRFTEAGYVGGDVEDIIRNLVEQTKNAEGDVDIEMAQYGIVYIDEIDKLASRGNTLGPDVSRGGVQQALLKIIEETTIELKNKMDLVSQMKAAKKLYEGKEIKEETINTRNILFIFSGAFSGLDSIIQKRTSEKTSAGFMGNINTQDDKSDINLIRKLDTVDLVKFGLESEFIGRIPVRVTMDYLDEEDLFSILKKPNSPIVMQFKNEMEAYGVEVEFKQEVLRFVAKKAASKMTGARGLLSAFGEVMGVYSTYLPDMGVSKICFDLAMVGDDVDQSSRIKIIEKYKNEISFQDYIDYISNKYYLNLEFDIEVAKSIVDYAKNEKISVYDFCYKLFYNYEQAFEYLAQRGIKEIQITKEIIDNPMQLDRLF